MGKDKTNQVTSGNTSGPSDPAEAPTLKPMGQEFADLKAEQEAQGRAVHDLETRLAQVVDVLERRVGSLDLKRFA